MFGRRPVGGSVLLSCAKRFRGSTVMDRGTVRSWVLMRDIIVVLS
jgi:hypothetical protein